MARKALFIIFFIPLLAGAQATQLAGVVTDKKGEPIIGANIFIEGTYDGATSDVTGAFAFFTELQGSAKLTVSYLGYHNFSKEIQLRGDSLHLEVRLREKINELNEVVISAGAFEASDEKKSVMLKPLDIVLTAGATADLAGALNTLPGTQTVGEEGRLFVRGGAAYETKTFIDGLLVLKPYTSTTPDLPARNRFSPFLFKGTLFSTGGYSAEYGQALSSALTLQTQDLAPETLTSLSLMSVGLGLSHTERWENSSLTIGGDYSNMSPYMSLVDQNVHWHLAPQGMNGQMVYRKKTSPSGMFKLMANASANHLALDYPRAEDLVLTRLDLFNRNLFVNTSFHEVLDDHWSVFMGLGFTEDVEKIDESFQLHTLERSFQLKNRWKYTANDRFSVLLGWEYWKQEFDRQYQAVDGPLISPYLQNHFGAGFAEANIHLSGKLATRIGLRSEYTSVIDRWTVGPRWSIACKTGEHAQMSFAYGQFFQTPENEQLIFKRDLNFEKATHFILNFQKIHNERIFRVEAYYKDYAHLIRFDSPQSAQVDNGGYGHARGVDLFYRDQKTIKNGDFWISYSFLDTERLFRDFPEASAPGFASRHNMALVYKQWVEGINSSLGLTYSYASPRPYDDPNTPVFNDRRTPAYHDLSFNASFLTHWFDNFTIIYASVSNVLGLDQNFGRRFSTLPGGNGQFSSIPVDPAARRFLFLGIFISLGQEMEL